MDSTAPPAPNHTHRLGPLRLDADQVPVPDLTRVCRHALCIADAVRWVEIAVPVRHGTTVTSSAGELSAAAVDAVGRGPRATAARSGVPVVVDDVASDTRWPVLRRESVGAPASLLVLPLGPVGGTLTLAAGAPAAFGPEVRAVAGEVARLAGRLLTVRDQPDGDPGARARDVVVAARALLARQEQVTPDAAFEMLLERAHRHSETVLACAEQVLDELGGVPADEQGRPPEPATLRRAITYLEEHAADDVDVADVAAAAGLGVRGLQMAFRRWRDTTPLAHLREVRLARAHQELRAADARTGGETVADIAARWHFTHPGRFSVTYRERYGCSPSETLRA
ncbi:AraC-like DNA-binding protein [Actinomycetospora succinea]|uniref:AraC-like DNA-binding protein n=1 Tax=Actinomycetospora succinea TaxID=663603 RepID=A0A4R6VLQ2_9PSEU|nr:helix-turn-helix domain-containing protein [Actinomycetospora succinea]TDQ62831.1 AraC-like DNA-binding protein [Actinomycetospora succinea]